MSETTANLRQAARDLPAQERIRLVLELWEDIEATDEQFPLTAGHKRVLDERIEAHRQDPSAARPWAEAKRDLLAKLGRS